MTRRRRLVATAVVGALAALLFVTGCTSSAGSAATKTTAGKTPTSAQLKATLVAASDITIDSFALSNTSPVSQSGAVGISGIFSNKAGDRVLSIILIHFPTAAFAEAGVSETQTLAAGELTRNPASDTEVKVGKQAHLYQGSNETGPLSILVYAEGNYIVTMEFVSTRAGDSVPASVVTALGLKQDAKVKAAG